MILGGHIPPKTFVKKLQIFWQKPTFFIDIYKCEHFVKI